MAINSSSRWEQVFQMFFKMLVNMFIKDWIMEEANNTMIDQFNNNCTNIEDCYSSTALFCNLTMKTCQCVKYHYFNEINRLCEFNITKFRISNKEEHEEYISANEPDETPIVDHEILNKLSSNLWLIKSVLILGFLSFILLTIYACRPRKDRNNLVRLLAKEKETACKINIMSTGIILHE